MLNISFTPINKQDGHFVSTVSAKCNTIASLSSSSNSQSTNPPSGHYNYKTIFSSRGVAGGGHYDMDDSSNTGGQADSNHLNESFSNSAHSASQNAAPGVLTRNSPTQSAVFIVCDRAQVKVSKNLLKKIPHHKYTNVVNISLFFQKSVAIITIFTFSFLSNNKAFYNSIASLC